MFRFLNKPISRPDLWAIHLRCTACSWKTTPAGPYRLRDVLSPPNKCLNCGEPAVMVVPDCPYCSQSILPPERAARQSGLRNICALVRVPRSPAQALWGHFTCPSCDGIFDKWGRAVTDSR